MSGPRFLVTVGTDHHQFDRLIGWVNDWLARHPGQVPSFFAQSGTAATEPACASARFLDSAQLGAALDGADVLICHGGPGSISDAWQRGMVPIVVPRVRRLGEVVDDHQVDFCRKLAGLGRVRLAEDAPGLTALLDEAIGGLSGFLTSEPPTEIAAAVARFDLLVGDLVAGPRRGPRAARRLTRRTRADLPVAVFDATGATLAQPTRPGGSRTPVHVGPGMVPEEEQ